jgi:thiol:disulfide interchange protein
VPTVYDGRMGSFLSAIGVAILVVGNIWFVINAFRVSILWGLGCLFLPFVSLFFLITNWDAARRPFWTALLGGALLFGGALITPRPMRNAIPEYQGDVAADTE